MLWEKKKRKTRLDRTGTRVPKFAMFELCLQAIGEAESREWFLAAQSLFSDEIKT